VPHEPGDVAGETADLAEDAAAGEQLPAEGLEQREGAGPVDRVGRDDVLGVGRVAFSDDPLVMKPSPIVPPAASWPM
jgi:hypothetical protein